MQTVYAHAFHCSKGISSTYITGDMSDVATSDAVCQEKYQLVFFTPEMIISKRQWRRLIGGEVYANRLKALIIDEAHCVKKWYVFTQ